jgi:hypothetical protein
LKDSKAYGVYFQQTIDSGTLTINGSFNVYAHIDTSTPYESVNFNDFTSYAVGVFFNDIIKGGTQAINGAFTINCDVADKTTTTRDHYHSSDGVYFNSKIWETTNQTINGTF